MTPERYQHIGQLFHVALELEAGQRAAFLAQSCAGDEALRGEVESLLASHEKAAELMAAPALAVAAKGLAEAPAPVLSGQRIGHYQILSPLGAGGMGQVYLAQDTKLGRPIALKLLPARLLQDAEQVRRFEREARAASALNHPNILTIHEIGEAEGSHYIVSEFVEGETLRERLRHGPLGVGEARGIAQQVAGALSVAHQAGIIHRDIKPENLMVRPDGLVKVLDFGLAKLTDQPAVRREVDSPGATLVPLSTQLWMVLGTVSYMSPEQARGQKLDRRSDIFSLGVVLYEMIAGRRPFEGATTSDVMAALLTAAPPPLRQAGAEAPAELERILGTCLRKDREDRYQTAEELLAELTSLQLIGPTADTPPPRKGQVAGRKVRLRHWRVVAALTAVLMIGLVWVLSSRSKPTVQPDQITSLAVLPLANLSGDPSQEYFADGMTEALINNLARIRALKVISRTSAMRYRGSNKSLPEIARELNVDAVIEGSVQKSGQRVRVTAQLVHPATDAHLWASEYERDLTDVLKLQSEVARAVADEIRIQVTAEERARLASARSVNPQAHEAYLLGRYHFSKNNEQDWKQAIEHFERAIELAPDYAAAYAGLSDAWMQLGIFGIKGFKEIEPPARAAALKAIELDEQLADARISLANIKHFCDWDWAGAEQEFRRVLELDPGDLDVHTYYGTLLMHVGRHDEAIREGQIAVQLDPISSTTQTSLGRFLYRARRYGEAVPHLKRAVELEPRSVGANFRLGDVYAELGRYEEAIAVFEKDRHLTGDERAFRAGIARVHGLMGRQSEARQMISVVNAQPILVAGVYAALGDKDEAFRVLEKAVEERNSLLVNIKEDPPLDNLHSDPRWKVLLRRMNYPEE
jgi:eukaryotic-like serine/threonine-protein kinase